MKKKPLPKWEREAIEALQALRFELPGQRSSALYVIGKLLDRCRRLERAAKRRRPA